MSISHIQNANIIIIDDDPVVCYLLASLAKSVTGNWPKTFTAPLDALVWCKENEPDLVLVDYMMPQYNGHEFIRLFRNIPNCTDVPIIMVTAANEIDVRTEALRLGAAEFLTKPVEAGEFRLRVRNLLMLRESQYLLENHEELLQHEVNKATETILQRERELIVRLSKAAEFRDPQTGSHILRMSHYSSLIAQQLGLPQTFQKDLFVAAPMHDIGKLGTPDHILLKPGKLNEDEMGIMKQHAGIGAKILSGSSSPLIQLAEEIALSHHEKFDGTGYPNGLAGAAIPLSGRITAVADVFDALTSVRPYKRAWPLYAAKNFINEGAGKQFCPTCVTAFNMAWDGVLEIRGRFPD